MMTMISLKPSHIQSVIHYVN